MSTKEQEIGAKLKAAKLYRTRTEIDELFESHRLLFSVLKSVLSTEKLDSDIQRKIADALAQANKWEE